MFIPAIIGHVPDDMVRALTSFMDFCYIVRRASHTEESLSSMQTALQRFHPFREVFHETGVCADFSLPCQHALVHYIQGICLFGSPNGLNH